MKKLNLSLTFILLALIGFSQVSIKKSTMYYADGQFGVFKTVKKMTGFTGGLSLNAIKGNNIYKVRYFYDERWEIFSPTEKYNEIGLLIGKSYYTKYFQANFSAGIGISFGEVVSKTTEHKYEDSGFNLISTYTTHEYQRFTTPAIPFEADFIVKPLKVIGLGLTIGGNLNLKRPTFRSTISFNIGKLR